jgi:microcystin-dependent protein
MATPLFSFTTLNGSDPAGHDSINALIKSIEDQLNSISSGLYAGAADTATTGQVLRWDGTTYANAFVNSASLVNGSVTVDKIDTSAVTETKIAPSAVTSGKIMSGVALAGQPTVGTATGAYPVAGNDLRIASVKYVNDAAAAVTAGTSFVVGGDLTGTTGNATIVPSAVTSDKILNNTILFEDLAAALQALLVPTGSIMPFAGTSAYVPSGWIMCYGQSYGAASASTALQTILNAASFSTIPDLRGRVIAGIDNMGGTDLGILSLANTPGTVGGNETHILTPAQTAIRNHYHNLSWESQGGGVAESPSVATGFSGLSASSGFGTGRQIQISDSVGGGRIAAYVGATTEANGAAHSSLQPTIVFNYIIKN